MKKAAFVILILIAVAFFFSPGAVQCQPGDSGYGGGPGYGYGMGPGMMGGYGYGPQGQGGGWYCPYCGSHMGGYGPPSRYQQSQKPISEKEAASIARTYIQRNPNLKVGTVKDVGNAFEAEIRTKNNELVDKILVDKSSGWIRPAY